MPATQEQSTLACQLTWKVTGVRTANEQAGNVRFLVAVIHNKDPERLSHILPAARHLADTLGAELQEVCEQPPIVPHSAWRAYWRSVTQTMLFARWRRYIEAEAVPGLSDLARLFVRDFGRYLIPGETSSRLRRFGAVDEIVTAKHVHAWRSGCEKSDFIVVFEDDAVFRQDSAEICANLVAELKDFPGDEHLYVDLAGGFPLEQLAVSHVTEKRTARYVHFRKPVTNTCCAYLMSAFTAKSFVSTLANKTWHRQHPGDWLLNRLMMQAVADGAEFTCFHASPPIFDHGSICGVHASWRS